ncbi:MAG: hypothetical protein LBL28_00150 [Treponema sp.]|jgi:hypothetical protein|nr:hypothetical protein [Treponema sp.]
MHSILKNSGIGVFIAIMLLYITCCEWGRFDKPSRELVLEYEVTGVTVRLNRSSESFPYILFVAMRRVTGGGGNYLNYYSDKERTKRITGDTLVTVNEKLPGAVHEDLEGNIRGAWFSVYLDFLPQEGDVAEFNQNVFYAIPNDFPQNWETVRIITKSMLIKIK